MSLSDARAFRGVSRPAREGVHARLGGQCGARAPSAEPRRSKSYTCHIVLASVKAFLGMGTVVLDGRLKQVSTVRTSDFTRLPAATEYSLVQTAYDKQQTVSPVD